MSDSENQEEKVSEELAETVRGWVKDDDDIKKLQNKIKEIKTGKKEKEEFILGFMDKKEEKVIRITGGRLRMNKSKTKTGVTPEHIQNCLYEILGDSAKALKMTKTIMDKRPTVERINLKRTNDRKKKSKK